MRSHFFHGVLFATTLATTLACAGVAEAAPPSDETTIAQRLFDEGLLLKERGRHADACPKLEESQRIDPGLGTQYHLADCYEKQGRLASAWGLFGELARQAAVSGQKEREIVARDRAAEILPRLPRLFVAVPADSDAGGLAITLDGVVVPRASWNAPQPIDPGSHEIVARVGKRTWRATVTLDARARIETLVIPDLLERTPVATNGGKDVGAAVTTTSVVTRATPRALPVIDTVNEQRSTTNTRRMVGWGVAAGGLFGLGAGTFFTVRSFDESSSAEDLGCTSSVCANQDGRDARSRAESARNVAIASYALGAAAAGVGLYLVLTSTDETNGAKPRVSARATPFGFDVAGTF